MQYYAGFVCNATRKNSSFINTGGLNIIENEPLLIQIGSDSLTGDGTIKIYILYHIVNL